MTFNELMFRLFFKINTMLLRISSGVRIIFLRVRGMAIGKNCHIAKLYFTWPHKVSLGNDSIIEHGVYFKFDGVYSPDKSIVIGRNVFIGNNCEFNICDKIIIGNTCLISSGCKFIDHDHGMAFDIAMNIQRPAVSPILIADDVWIGVNSVILKGVTIGKGAVIAAGSVVTKNVGEFEIVAGVPAKIIKKRM